ncbi:histidine phosphatase family protein [Lentibacillus sp. L22]|uniref:histidine phosphatase family protein n=1 Tax=Lentibacillus TaxID=175304 RepID=UPI0022B0B2C9|nr:histidine phosphatase family protein [Lentibacillus daqui]
MDDGVAISLLRHGMTEENQRGAYIGWTDVSLSTEGKGILKRNKPCMKTVDQLFSSDLRRCLETAAILFPNLPIQKRTAFREMNFGLWEGRTYEELKQLTSYRQWLDDPFHCHPDGGETFTVFEKRVVAGFALVKDKMMDTNAKESVIVTHGGVIRLLLSTICNRSFFNWKIPYGGGYRLIWTKDDFRRGDKCMSLQEVPITENQRG